MFLVTCNSLSLLGSSDIVCTIEQEFTGLLNAPVVFAHNDLLSGNLMLNEEEGEKSSFFSAFNYSS